MKIPECDKGKNHCSNCNSHFVTQRPKINEIVINSQFEKDLKDEKERGDLINKILSCDAENFHELHKFEFSIKNNYIFRAKRGDVHVVYSISGSRLTFLRAIRNFRKYEKFLNSEIYKYF